ncbi:MAG TPA: DUF1731 domain-containing protein [Candidatus Saccharimonadales bacterium]|nr:DUF1731 domain-containing protein [Candidatus Saccharimonadales bacterium]
MPEKRPRRIVLPGGNGHVGKLIAAYFHGKGDDVVVLSRTAIANPWRMVRWDGLTPGRWARELENADVVINLAGRSVDCRYTTGNRKEILDSRVNSTRVIGQVIGSLAHPPRIWMNMSTATIYRHALDRPMDELTGEIGGGEPDVPATWRFSYEVATRWEQELLTANAPRTRRIALRSAMVMNTDRGGIFDTLLRLVRCGLGGAAASGQQFISWIHGLDFLRAIEFLIERGELNGAINIASPHPLPNREFMAELRAAWGMPIGLPASRWMLELGAFLLRTESELILKSRRVIPGRLSAAGFSFLFPQWRAAVQQLVALRREGLPGDSTARSGAQARSA